MFLVFGSLSPTIRPFLLSLFPAMERKDRVLRVLFRTSLLDLVYIDGPSTFILISSGVSHIRRSTSSFPLEGFKFLFNLLIGPVGSLRRCPWVRQLQKLHGPLLRDDKYLER